MQRGSRAPESAFTVLLGQIVPDHLGLFYCGEHVVEGFSLRILVIDSYPEAVAESVCYVFPEALTGVVGQAAIPLLSMEGAVHCALLPCPVGVMSATAGGMHPAATNRLCTGTCLRGWAREMLVAGASYNPRPLHAACRACNPSMYCAINNIATSQ